MSKKHELELVVALPPSTNSLYINQSYFDKKSGNYIPTGKRILSKEGRHLKSVIATQADIQTFQQGWDKESIGDDFIYMDAVIYFNRKGRDADNIYKALQDSLQGIVYNNDSQVLVRTQKILFDRSNPRVEITFSKVGFKGIFDDVEESLAFQENCNTCSRFLNGRCSILLDSMGGVIREEVVDKNCTSYTKRKK